MGNPGKREYANSVKLDVAKCKGCTTCIKHCPTEAIRVRRGKATILKERCIDCGECIRVCPHKAKVAVCDPFSRLEEFSYNIALPAPSLYGQFHHLDDVNIVLQALLDIGFDQIFEVARSAETISEYMRGKMQDRQLPRPVISSACPACVRMICQRFPKLIANVAPVIAPVDLAALRAREDAMRETGLPAEKIGVFFITPCPAKMTAVHNPMGLPHPVIDGALSMTDVYLRLLPAMKKVIDPPQLLTAGLIGIGWAASGGESASLLGETYIAVDGVENVVSVLEDVENGKLTEVEFIEVGACTQGCLGGCLTVENAFSSKARLKRLMKYLPLSHRPTRQLDPEDAPTPRGLNPALLRWKTLPEYTPVWQLDADYKSALEKHGQIMQLSHRLPGLDCASCGAPSCRAFAEDVVLGYAQESDCIFLHREKMGAGDYLPPPFRT